MSGGGGDDDRAPGSRYLYEAFDGDRERERELRKLLNLVREIGSTEKIRERMRAVDELIEEKKRRDWLFATIRAAAVWATAVAAGWLTVRGMLSDFIQGLQK